MNVITPPATLAQRIITAAKAFALQVVPLQARIDAALRNRGTTKADVDRLLVDVAAASTGLQLRTAAAQARVTAAKASVARLTAKSGQLEVQRHRLSDLAHDRLRGPQRTIRGTVSLQPRKETP